MNSSGSLPTLKAIRPEMASAANIYVYTDLKNVFTDSDEFCTWLFSKMVFITQLFNQIYKFFTS